MIPSSQEYVSKLKTSMEIFTLSTQTEQPLLNMGYPLGRGYLDVVLQK